MKKFGALLAAVAMLFVMVISAGCAQEHDWQLQGLEVTQQPQKTQYVAGEAFDKTGMQIMAVYADGDEQMRVDVSAAVTLPDGALEEGQTQVTISYTEGEVTVQAQVAVTVTAPEPSGPADYGTLTIADVHLYNMYPSAPLIITFSEPAYEGEYISYQFVSDEFTIRNGVASLTGSVVLPSEMEVTARTQYHTATFTVYMAASFTDHDSQAADRESTMANRMRVGLYREGGVVFAGDSFFDPEFWTDFYGDYSGRNAALIGIGGSRADEWSVLAERLLYPYAPSAVALSIGTNDLGRNESVETVVAELQELFGRIHELLPETQVCWYTLAPRADTTALTERIPAVNAAISEWAQGKEWFTLLDVYTLYLNEDGSVDWSLLKSDRLHPQLTTYDDLYMALLEQAGIVPGAL